MEQKSALLSKIQEYLTEGGIEIAEDKLIELVLQFAFERRDELVKMLKEHHSEEILRKWLETPVEVEESDALKEHDMVL